MFQHSNKVVSTSSLKKVMKACFCSSAYVQNLSSEPNSRLFREELDSSISMMKLYLSFNRILIADLTRNPQGTTCCFHETGEIYKTKKTSWQV